MKTTMKNVYSTASAIIIIIYMFNNFLYSVSFHELLEYVRKSRREFMSIWR